MGSPLKLKVFEAHCPLVATWTSGTVGDLRTAFQQPGSGWEDQAAKPVLGGLWLEFSGQDLINNLG